MADIARRYVTAQLLNAAFRIAAATLWRLASHAPLRSGESVRFREHRLSWPCAFFVFACVVSGTAAAAAPEPLIFLGDRALPPYEYLRRGEPRGANVDLAFAIGKVLGRPVEVRLMDWAEAQSRLQAGEGHALTFLGKTDERDQLYDFSQPTLPFTFALFVRAGEEQSFSPGKLIGKHIGVTEAGLPRSYFEQKHPEATLVTIENTADGVRRLVAGDIDGFAANAWVALFLLKELGISSVTALAPFAERRGNIAVRQGEVALLAQIDGALDELNRNGEFYRIIDRWSYTKVHLFSNAAVRFATIAAGVAALALLLLGATMIRLSRNKRALKVALDSAGVERSRLAAALEAHRQAEAELRESEGRLRLATEAAGMFFWDCDFSSQTMRWSANAANVIGCKPDELPSEMARATFFVAPEDRERLFQEFEAGIRPGRKTFTTEFRGSPAGGRDKHWCAQARILRDEHGAPTRVYGVTQDVTERKRAEQAQREADRRKDEFLATLAHELRNPLAPIRNAVHILKLIGPADPTLQSARDMIDRQLQHMVRLIDDLLDISRISRGRLELRRQPISLASVITHALETENPNLHHEIAVSLPQEPVYLDADPVRLAQVFSNLLNNACKYTEKGGAMSISAHRDGMFVIVKVKDSGIGIAPGDLASLFQMFSQVGTALDRSQGGLGIGLSLTRALVEMHGGSIEASSDGPGKGSEFTVRLPVLADTAALNSTLADGADEDVAVTARRVLVADDNQDGAESLAMSLRLTGNNVETAYDGVEALHKAETHRPDVILLDIGMPKLNGYATCRLIRGQPWGRNTVIVAVTGWGQEADRQKSKEAGFDAHLVKPVDHDALVKLLASCAPQQNPVERLGNVK